MARGNKSIFNITSYHFRVYIFLHLPGIIHVGWWSVLLQRMTQNFPCLKEKTHPPLECIYKNAWKCHWINMSLSIVWTFFVFQEFLPPYKYQFPSKKIIWVAWKIRMYESVCTTEEKASDKRRPLRYPIEPIIQLYSWWYNALHSNQGVLTQKEVKWLSRIIHLNALAFLQKYESTFNQYQRCTSIYSNIYIYQYI